MRHETEIAFRRKVCAIWLDQGMALAAQDLPWPDAKPALSQAIATVNPGAETIRKVLEHIRRIWFEPPEGLALLRSEALRLFRAETSPDSQILLNWGMSIAAYPFVGSVAEALGRLLKLQSEANRADVQRRLREQYGDRDFVNRITRYNISSFLDWGIIAEGDKGGIYTPTKQRNPKRTEQLAWLAEALLISRDKTQMPLSELYSHPALFPIALQALNASALQTNPRLRVERQSLNQDFVFLHVEPPRQKRPHSRFTLSA
jgi:hypothetical protein